MMNYLRFWRDSIVFTLKGNWKFYLWINFLGVLIFMGVMAYIRQFKLGLIVSNLSDQVSWGAYIANFTFLVGVAAAAVLMVVPAYVYHNKAVKEVVLLGELLAVSAIVMCLLFILADMGRPDRFSHILPYLGRLNFPRSVLAWDVIVLNGYLALNMHITGYVLYCKYTKREPYKWIYLPFVFLSIFWAVSIHTVTAFLYSGLGGRPFWNSAILAPRFLVSAFAGGPAILTIALRVIQKTKLLHVSEEVFQLFKKIIAVSVPVNMFLLFCEVFKEFYTDSLHTASAQYLFFGLHGHNLLTPYIWTAIGFNTFGLIVFVTKPLREKEWLFLTAAVFSIIGIWVEKGMGLIIPGFIPTPLGEIVEYTPSVNEIYVCLGIWAFGGLVYTLLSKAACGVLSGKVKSIH